MKKIIKKYLKKIIKKCIKNGFFRTFKNVNVEILAFYELHNS